ncbi:MAG: carbohydrate ABC transporter permease, partial [Actinocrinis sp.]
MTSTRQPPHRLAKAPAGAETAAPAPEPERRAVRRDDRVKRGRPGASQLAAWAFLAPVTVYLLLFYAYPLYRNLDLSLRDYTVYTFVHGGAPFTGLANYRSVFGNPAFAPALIHTLVFTGVSLAFQFAIGLALAVFFSQHFRLSALLRALFLVPWLL